MTSLRQRIVYTYTQTLCFTYLCLLTDALTITQTCWLYILDTYITNEKQHVVFTIYVYI